MEKSSKWYKKRKNDVIWWYDNSGLYVGHHIFSFDKKNEFNLFADYPHKLTPEQKKIFDRENPFWKDFFADRQ